ncbi:MAG: hypothetical protein KC549_15595 [Myxococcales bacterium]|nr:hypothetical protein [Myxococcales bacterium]
MYQRLAAAGEADCHTLHYLQMACEKVAKAYRIRDLDAEIEELTQHHVGFARFVRAFLLSPAMRPDFEHQAARLQAVMRGMHTLAREIERLAPAVDRELRPDNSEYPWLAGGTVVAPCDYDFPNLSLLMAASGRALLKLVRRAMDEFEQIHIT